MELRTRTSRFKSERCPDGGSTVALLGCALLGLAALRRKLPLLRVSEAHESNNTEKQNAYRKNMPFTASWQRSRSLFSVRPAEAYTVTLQQMGADVVATRRREHVVDRLEFPR